LALSGRSGVVLCDEVFPSKEAGKVEGFLDRHQIAVVSAVEPNSFLPIVESITSSLGRHSSYLTPCYEPLQLRLV